MRLAKFSMSIMAPGPHAIIDLQFVARFDFNATKWQFVDMRKFLGDSSDGIIRSGVAMLDLQVLIDSYSAESLFQFMLDDSRERTASSSISNTGEAR